LGYTISKCYKIGKAFLKVRFSSSDACDRVDEYEFLN
jgi:hypothetical protein